MIIPIRCVTCGKVLADKWEYYKKKVTELEKKKTHNNFDDIKTKDILDELKLTRYCCRRVFLGHVDIIDEI